MKPKMSKLGKEILGDAKLSSALVETLIQKNSELSSGEIIDFEAISKTGEEIRYSLIIASASTSSIK